MMQGETLTVVVCIAVSLNGKKEGWTSGAEDFHFTSIFRDTTATSFLTISPQNLLAFTARKGFVIPNLRLCYIQPKSLLSKHRYMFSCSDHSQIWSYYKSHPHQFYFYFLISSSSFWLDAKKFFLFYRNCTALLKASISLFIYKIVKYLPAYQILGGIQMQGYNTWSSPTRSSPPMASNC